MTGQILLIHYSEIGTKGNNRSFFERKLRDEVARRLQPALARKVTVDHGRLIAELAPQAPETLVHDAMKKIFGVAWYSFGQNTRREYADIEKHCLAQAQAAAGAKTFKVFCRRADKTFPIASEEMCRRLGDAVRLQVGLAVNLKHHDLAISVEILPDRALVHGQKFPGLRGMPPGTSGRLLCLFSGGIDSPVAAWSLMRRGAVVHLLHFHPYASAEELKDTKIFTLYNILRDFSPPTRLFLVPHDRYQVAASLQVPPEVETVVFRRYMLRVAEALAREIKLKALVTGDCLGQVASQTLDNWVAAQEGLNIPVMAPLIAQDKDDIVAQAQKIGTFEPSVLLYKDCCSLLSHRPKTNVTVEEASQLDEALNLPKLVEESLASLEVWDGENLRRFTRFLPQFEKRP